MTVVAVEGEMLKFGVGTVTVIVALCVREPLVPVTFTRYVPGAMLLVAVMARLDIPEPVVILDGVGVPDRPAGNATVNCTVPVNPNSGATLIVDV